MSNNQQAKGERFVSNSVPKIELVGQVGNAVYFPHSNETGEFFVDIYSTSDIVTVDVERSDGVKRKKESELIPQYLEQHHYQLRAKYRVTIPWLDAGITGSYTITATNKKGETAKLEIRLHKVEGVLCNSSKTSVFLLSHTHHTHTYTHTHTHTQN